MPIRLVVAANHTLGDWAPHNFPTLVDFNPENGHVVALREANAMDVAAFPSTANPEQLEQAVDEYFMNMQSKVDNIPDLVVSPKIRKRRLMVPNFKHPYSTLEDFRLRLSGSLITIAGEIYYVKDTVRSGKEFYLVVQSSEDYKKKQSKKINYSSEHIDTRPIEPHYLQYIDKPMFLVRPPRRQQRQGMTHDNTYVKPVGESRYQNADMMELAACLVPRDNLIWNETFHDLMVKQRLFSSLRLSNHIALYMGYDDREDEDERKMFAEFRGRRLGAVRERTIILDEDDCNQPWITEAVKSVGMSYVQEK